MLEHRTGIKKVVCGLAFWMVTMTGLAQAQFNISPSQENYIFEGRCAQEVLLTVTWTGQDGPPTGKHAIYFKNGTGTSEECILDNWTGKTTTVKLKLEPSKNGLFWIADPNSSATRLSNALEAVFQCNRIGGGGSGKVSQSFADDGGARINITQKGSGGTCPAKITITGTISPTKPPNVPQKVWERSRQVIWYKFISSSPLLKQVGIPPGSPPDMVYRLDFPPNEPKTQSIKPTEWLLTKGPVPPPVTKATLTIRTQLPKPGGGYRDGSASFQIELSCKPSSSPQPADRNQQSN